MCVHVCARLGEIDVVGAIAKALNWWKVLFSIDIAQLIKPSELYHYLDIAETMDAVLLVVRMSRFIAAHWFDSKQQRLINCEDILAVMNSYFNLFWDRTLIIPEVQLT